jgi:hypothetical protein
MHGGALHQDGRRAPTKSLRVAPEVMNGTRNYPRASTHDTTGSTPGSLVFSPELRLPCDLLFGAPPDKERPTTVQAAELMDHLHNIHNYARQHLKLASDRMKTRIDKLANTAGYHKGNRVLFYR